MVQRFNKQKYFRALKPSCLITGDAMYVIESLSAALQTQIVREDRLL